MTKALQLEAIPHHPEADSFDFRRSLMTLKHACSAHKLLIAMTCVLTVSLTILYVVVWPPVFVAQAQLYGEPDNDQFRANFYQTWNVFRRERISDEVHMFTADPVLAEVIDRMGLTYADVYHPFLRYLGYLWTESLPGRTYRRIKEWILPPQRGPYDPTPQEIDRARTLYDFKEGVSIEPIAQSSVGILTVRGPSPRVAEIANTIVEVYFDQRRARYVQEANIAYEALDRELAKAREEIFALQTQMQDYYSKNSLLLTFEKDKIDLGVSAALRSEIDDLRTAIASAEKKLAEVNRQFSEEERNVVTASVIAANPIKDGLRDKLTQLELARKQTLIRYRPDSPEVVELEKQIVIVSDQLQQEPDTSFRQNTVVLSSNYEALRAMRDQIQTELAGARASLAARLSTYDQAERGLDTIPEKMRVVRDFDREHQALERKYQAIQDKLMIAAVSRATAQSAPGSLQVVANASAPSQKSWPMTKLLLSLSVVFGLLAGVGLALVTDLFFGRVHRYRLAENGNGEMSVYALVGRDRDFVAALLTSRILREEERGRRLLKHLD